ncbi:MAG: thiamine-monophosphate kinase [Candidatus Syntrophoarchaeum caldarius]|uniref:Thiamine-monophosphate kinase n=1 Tax=Candidatus Syntropharchaeum caldarium TaxID=1838285 RepID=A0A1F2PB16_9EURY|nr:MAG: thiamine-monophosphate kinase [Candidatus Syntrophoarchaeum caldarius]
MSELLRDAGERRLIELVSSYFDCEEEDCAVVEIQGAQILISSDMLHQKTDFPAQMTPYQMGWSLVAVNLSDIAAMGAKPLYFLSALGLPSDFELESFKELISGIESCTSRFGVEVIGGDLDSHDEITLTGTVIGTPGDGKIVRRSGASIGDLVCVTGYLGSAGGGLRLLKEDENLDQTNPLVKALLEPFPRVEEGLILSNSGYVTSMTDISDGLLVSLSDLSRASGISFKIDEEKIPVYSDDLLEFAWSAGGDYELLFTVRREKIDELEELVDFTVIGSVVAKGAGDRLSPLGYDHFRGMRNSDFYASK